MNKKKEEAQFSPILKEMIEFRKDFYEFIVIFLDILKDSYVSKEKWNRLEELHTKTLLKFGYLKPLINELADMANIDLNSTWINAMNMAVRDNKKEDLSICLQATTVAIGKLEDDIKKGKRDPNTGERIGVISTKTDTSIKPKAFIVHGGKTEARGKLQRFLTALGITPFIIEEEPKEGRSVNEQVEYYSEQADCAIILGTADDKELKDGKLYPRRNVHIEIGRFQEKFPNRIIYLLEEGASFPSDISEKLYTPFTQESMDEALISVARELRKFGILIAVKP